MMRAVRILWRGVHWLLCTVFDFHLRTELADDEIAMWRQCCDCGDQIYAQLRPHFVARDFPSARPNPPPPPDRRRGAA